jgi:cytochrome c oxidase accessory protein FixG
MNEDGSRIVIRPKLFRGKTYRYRLILGLVLIALFVAIPFVELRGKPLILLDIPARHFTLFGRTFLPTDGALLMLLLLAVFVAVIWLTALVGRSWCGWGCPQTVYMELVFRPLEVLFEGNRASQLRLDRQRWSLRRIAKHLTFLVLSVALGNLFLSYFVGVEALGRWVRASPVEHPTAFATMAVVSLLVFADFAWFREQMCTVVCPYARLQAVLLDPHSLIVGYDRMRGEPRGKGKRREGLGDCVDCANCVLACPTGIDIRDGLQLECIACAQCVDACDGVMQRVRKPTGLIRYGSQRTLEHGQESRIVRPRVIAYPLLIVALVSAMLILGGKNVQAEVTLLRGIGAPFAIADGKATNQIRIKVQNRTSSERSYHIELVSRPGIRLIAPENPLRVEAESHETTSVFVAAPIEYFELGLLPVEFRITDGNGFERTIPYRLLGPQAVKQAGDTP